MVFMGLGRWFVYAVLSREATCVGWNRRLRITNLIGKRRPLLMGRFGVVFYTNSRKACSR